jgi:hypothetical protein
MEHESRVVAALRGLGPLVSERLFGALELVVDELDVVAAPDAVSHLTPRTGSFSWLSTDSESEAVKGLRLLGILHPGAAELVVDVSAALVRHEAVAGLLVVGPEITGERAVAWRHGAVHLALCVATSAALLRALGSDTAGTTPTVIGTALGAAALVLTEVPMPTAYAAAVLEKRRAEYRYPQSSSASPEVRDHRFALADGPVPDEADFSGNGLVAVVPGGVVVRTARADGNVSASLRVLGEPPSDEVDPNGWDEIVEVSWTAEVGGAAFGQANGWRRAETPPWPGEYRVRVHARGRDGDLSEAYELTVWRAPAAAEVVHLCTDRLGHRLRGEPEPPVVVAPEAEHRWIEDSLLGVAATITVVVGLPEADVVRAFGADPAEPESAEDLREDYGQPWIAVLAVDGAVFVFEVNGFRGTDEDVLERLSREGRAASAFWNVNAVTRLSFARDGEELASFEPDEDEPFPSDDPEVLAALDGLDFADYRHQTAKLVTAVARFTGHVVTPAHPAAAQVAYYLADVRARPATPDAGA